MMASAPRLTLKALFSAAVASGFLFFASAVQAQQEMSVEELEAFILEKKAALDASVEDRDSNMEEQKKLGSMLEEQEAKQKKIEQELRALCDEREEAEPGSLSACLDEMNLAVN